MVYRKTADLIIYSTMSDRRNEGESIMWEKVFLAVLIGALRVLTSECKKEYCMKLKIQ